MPFILGLSYNSISEDFYKYACENILLKEKEAVEKYGYKIEHRIEHGVVNLFRDAHTSIKAKKKRDLEDSNPF